MSFMENRSEISICNRALSRIKQVPLTGSLDDAVNQNKHAARECRLWYKTIVRQVLSRHHWGLATERVALVAQTNDREAEWAAAYQPPSDMAFPVMIGPYTSTTGVSYYAGIGYLLASLYGRPLFRYEGGTIYAQLSGAVLDYVSLNLTEQDFNEAVETLIVMFLSAQLARSVAKDDELAERLHDEAVQRMNIEIAQNLNLSQPRYDTRPSEIELARQGIDPWMAPYGLYR